MTKLIDDLNLWYDYVNGRMPVRYSFTPKTKKYDKKIIDLHGLTLNDAYELVKYTIFQEYKEITVITGASGEIKRQFPLWLENFELSPKVRSVSKINSGSFLIKTIKLKRSK